MKKLLILLATLCVISSVAAQTVEKQTFLYAIKDADSLRLDRYVVSSPSQQKPCMIFVFGGGFIAGERDKASYIPYFEYMASRGFVVVAIDYRLGLKKALANGPIAEDAFAPAWLSTLAMATEDLYEATNYVLQHATAWGIDPSRILSCGSSAGAITVLHGEYYICNGGVLAKKLPAGFNYAGVISFAGAIFEMGQTLRWDKTPAPIMLFHGDADKNVPYGAIFYMGAGFFGSQAIAQQLTQMRVPHYLYSVQNTNHVMAVKPMDDNRYEIDEFIDKLVFQKLPLIINTEVCPLDKPEVPKLFTISDYLQSNFGE